MINIKTNVKGINICVKDIIHALPNIACWTGICTTTLTLLPLSHLLTSPLHRGIRNTHPSLKRRWKQRPDERESSAEKSCVIVVSLNTYTYGTREKISLKLTTRRVRELV